MGYHECIPSYLTAPRFRRETDLSDLTGSTLNDYRVLRRLGKGAMAEVYLAEQCSLARQVALKVLSTELASNPAYVERFQHEARSAAALVHANIVQVYEVGQSNGSHYIAQEYVAGQNLGDLVRRQGPLDPGRVLDVLRQVAAALSRAHERSIVHRDIKPENLILARSGEVKVADFGLARVVTQDATNRTQAGLTLGTPLYMSPEQIEGRPLDSRSDIYSLGITAYHLLTGEPPFQGDSPLAVAMQHLNKTAPSLTGRVPPTPTALAELVERMMAKDPAQRFADPADLLRALHVVAKTAAAEGWAEGPESWPLGDLAAETQADLAATEQLGEVLQKVRRLSRGGSRSPLLWGAVLSALLGGLIAASLRQPFALADSQPPLPQYDNPFQQLLHAKLANTPEAWKAVWDERFGEIDPFNRHFAEQGLVRYYFNHGQPDDYRAALPYLRNLAALSQNQSRLRLFGMVGLAVAYAELGNIEQSERIRIQLTPDDIATLRETDPELVEHYLRVGS
jgi:serine/threonine protein kinase